MMRLREFILSEQNIYLAIYAVKSYVFDPQLLDREDKELLNFLLDPFNEELIYRVIEDVKNIVENIIDNDCYLFETQVYFKPKDYLATELIYRPIHTSQLKQLIAMVAVMHPLIYEIPDSKDSWKLNLSNYSRLIPNNFYGNRVSRKPEELFKKWNEQYKLYTQKANEYFKTYHESKEYKYELKLDLKNFFPSVDPKLIYGILIENMPVTLSDEDDISVFKTIIYKLLVCRVTNLETALSKERYYESDNIDSSYTKGIAQGLPQSYFFGNICMIEIAKIFDDLFKGRSVYYVDDSYIYTNEDIKDKADFKERLNKVNIKIKEMTSRYVTRAEMDMDIREEMRCKFLEKKYGIEVHVREKSTFSKIQDSKEGEIYLRTLSREASQIGADITSAYSEEEDVAMMHKTEALLKSIELERSGEIDKSYAEKLERYYKFFKYRAIKLKLKTENDLHANLFAVLVDDFTEDESKNLYRCLSQKGISVKKFFQNYKHDIWQVAISMLISNTVYEYEHNSIREYIRKIVMAVYPTEMLRCSYIQKMYEDYLNAIEVRNSPDYYATLEKQVNRKMVRYANMNTVVLREKFEGVLLEGLEENILGSFEICTKRFIKMCEIVNMNSYRLRRMFLNAVYSKVFRVTLSEDVVLNSYDKKGITYGELRVLVYLRNVNFDMCKFRNWKIELMSAENLQNVDYTIFEVLGAYKRYVVSPENIDNLVVIHKYTCDVWKNGAKHLYFYTLHNQEHAVDLVKNIIKIVKVFSYLKISNYDYYVLFIACYLHDISMVRIASENDFLLDKGDSEKITTALDEKWNTSMTTSDTKKVIIETYKAVDNFFEQKIRSKHAKDSAEEIRKMKEFDFLGESVRECVAEIAESHMMDTKDIYFVKGDAKNRLISYKFDKILLRFADLLDMSEHRVSKPILNHNIDNMSLVSAFHWVSHLLTEGYTLLSEYDTAPNAIPSSSLAPGIITETVTLSIYVSLSQFSKMKSKKCECGRINEKTLSENGFSIELSRDKEVCNSNKCNFLCRWFNDKNFYLVKEMQALEAYLERIPVRERFYNTKILIKVIVNNPTHISDEQFDILKRKISEKI